MTTVTKQADENVPTARFCGETGASLCRTRISAVGLRSDEVSHAVAAAAFVDASGPSGSAVLRASIYRPAGFDPSASWPCLLFLNGMGESGVDGTKQLSVGLAPAILANPERWPFVVLFPQKPAPEDEWEDHETAVLALLDRAIREHGVDPRRIGITGLSQGGHGAWEIARRHPARFACLAPICGYPAAPVRGWRNFDRARDWTLDSACFAAAKLADALHTKPIWTVHGVADPVVPVAFTDVVVEALRALGGQPNYDRLAGVQHDAWTAAYGNPAMAEWFRDQIGAR